MELHKKWKDGKNKKKKYNILFISKFNKLFELNLIKIKLIWKIKKK